MRTIAKATLTFDLAKLAENAQSVVRHLQGVEIVGVTKVTCGDPEFARAMLEGGVRALGESRLENAARLRDASVTAPIWLLRAPTPDLAEDTVRLTDVALVSEPVCVRALDAAAERAGRRYQIVAMVDIGDLREGVMPSELPDFLAMAERCEHIDVLGIGASLTCYGAIVPDAENLGLLLDLAHAAEKQLGRRLLVSGGSSTSIEPVASGRVPAGIDNLRIGEAIVLGVDPATREPVPGFGLHTGALTLSAPVIECQLKPTKPIGTSAQDAFGNRPTPRTWDSCWISRTLPRSSSGGGCSSLAAVLPRSSRSRPAASPPASATCASARPSCSG